MTAELPPEDRPPAQWRRFVTDEEAAAGHPAHRLDNPVFIAHLFCEALRDPVGDINALRQLVTPESLDDWGDFSEASARLLAVPNRGYASQVNEAFGAPDVVYFKILPNVTEAYQVIDDQILRAMQVTLVWRPEHGQWFVHGIGAPILPEDVPRTAG